MKVIVDRVLDACIAGGVEIHGLHATVAPRRQGQQTPPTLEEFHFVPYKESEVYSNTGLRQYSRIVQAYIQKSVNALLADGTSKFHNAEIFKNVLQDEETVFELNDEEIQSYLDAPGCGLIRVLKSIFEPAAEEDFVEHVKKMLAENKQELVSDQLLSALLCERTLKTSLDVALENSTSLTKMKVVEIGASEGHMFPKVIKYLNSQPMLSIALTATGDQLNSIDQALAEGLGVETMPWDLGNVPPTQICGADIVVANGVLHREADVAEALANIYQVLKDDGFLVLHEMTQNFSIPLALHGFTQDFSSHAGRPTGPCDEATWCNLLQSAHFEVVAQKSDGLLSTLFLCRKRSLQSEPPVATLLNVSDLKEFAWVPDVKASLLKHQDAPADHTLWLVVDGAPESGIVGMVNCLKQEPGGNRLRLVSYTNLV